MKALVRLLSIELKGFKNVERGRISLPGGHLSNFREAEADIIGIYGQNGSGKTTIIEALSLLETLLTAGKLPADARYMINTACCQAECCFEFFIDNQIDPPCKVKYACRLSSFADGSLTIGERLACRNMTSDGAWGKQHLLLQYDPNHSSPFSPKNVFTKPENDCRRLLLSACQSGFRNKHSLLFSAAFMEFFAENATQVHPLKSLLRTLQDYGSSNLFVINNSHATFSTNMVLPIAFKNSDGEVEAFPLLLNGPIVIDLTSYQAVKAIFHNLNTALATIVPGLAIVIKEYGQKQREDGTEGMCFELCTGRDGHQVPLKYESEGIKKIISVVRLIAELYNNPSICVAIDELDAGIFEYLLGLLLKVIRESGRGQLIFTSHNLRPLEMLDKKSLIFTTTNPARRYLRMTQVKSSNNLRDMYLRTISLGGQKESLYEPTQESAIRRALRNAGGDEL